METARQTPHPCAAAEVHRVVHQLQHEVLPVDVDAAPEVRDARSQAVTLVGFRQSEAEQVEHTHDHMEGSRDPQVEQEVEHQELQQTREAVHGSAGDQQEQIYPAVKK